MTSQEKNRSGPNVWMITTFAVLAIFAASFLITDRGATGAVISTASMEQVGKNSMNFINDRLLDNRTTATFVNITEKSDLYLLVFEIDGQKYRTFVSKDGKYLFPQMVDTGVFEEVPVSIAVPEERH